MGSSRLWQLFRFGVPGDILSKIESLEYNNNKYSVPVDVILTEEYKDFWWIMEYFSPDFGIQIPETIKSDCSYFDGATIKTGKKSFGIYPMDQPDLYYEVKMSKDGTVTILKSSISGGDTPA